jgi:hypothetical protein
MPNKALIPQHLNQRRHTLITNPPPRQGSQQRTAINHYQQERRNLIAPRGIFYVQSRCRPCVKPHRNLIANRLQNRVTTPRRYSNFAP